MIWLVMEIAENASMSAGVRTIAHKILSNITPPPGKASPGREISVIFPVPGRKKAAPKSVALRRAVFINPRYHSNCAFAPLARLVFKPPTFTQSHESRLLPLGFTASARKGWAVWKLFAAGFQLPRLSVCDAAPAVFVIAFLSYEIMQMIAHMPRLVKPGA